MEKECQHCKKTFTVQRIDSVYCSRSCRQMAYVARKAAQLKTVALNPVSEETAQITGPEPVEQKPIEKPVLKSIEKEYEDHQSNFLNILREQLEDDHDLMALHNCIVNHEDIHSYWVGLRLRCLAECLLLFSEARFTPVVDLMEICNAFTIMQRSIHYKSLPTMFPYFSAIENLGKKLKKLCLKVQKAEKIKFRMETGDKMELIVMRYCLSQFIRRERFNNLKFE